MSETDNTAAQDLASLKLPELRKMAAERGLRGVSALRKGDLIAAIETAGGRSRSQQEQPQQPGRQATPARPGLPRACRQDG